MAADAGCRGGSCAYALLGFTACGKGSDGGRCVMAGGERYAAFRAAQAVLDKGGAPGPAGYCAQGTIRPGNEPGADGSGGPEIAASEPEVPVPEGPVYPLARAGRNGHGVPVRGPGVNRDA